jgi:UDP-N-acetylglucosamine:LPS N-acetylglucosamine transferase
VTPVVAVLRELKHRDKDVEVRFWCDRKFAPQAQSIMHHFDDTIPVQPIFSGKLRRYNALPLWRQFLRPVSIVFPNLRDMFFVFFGFVQSFFKLLVWRPDVLFAGWICS